MTACFSPFHLFAVSISFAYAMEKVHVGHGHGYRSSKPWLPRESVITAPTGQELVAAKALPSLFDWRNVGGRSFATPDLNQHIPIYCGSCYIHGAVHALNDRIKVLRNAQYPDVIVSRQALMNCVPDPSNASLPPPGCGGGDAFQVHHYLHTNKIPDDSCLPYTATNMGCTPDTVCRNCAGKPNPKTGVMEPDFCYAVENWAGYGVGDYGNVSGEDAMMREIFARGPIACSAACDHDFMYNYSSNAGVLKEGVYITDTNFTKDDIDHVMEVTGWGETESGTKYWIVRNSWGTYWGDMGWVKIRRGVNQNQIEFDCDWAVPTFDDLETQLKSRVLGDYMKGTTNAGPRLGGIPGAEVDSIVAGLSIHNVPAAGGATLLVAIASALAGSLGTLLIVKRRQGSVAQPALLG